MKETKQLLEATCPECRGPLSEVRQEGGEVEYRCLVGHSFSARGLLQAHSEVQENALWAAVVALEESANLVRSLGPDLPPELLRTLERQAAEKMRQAAEIREILKQLEPFQVAADNAGGLSGG
jgi:two-component system chemotaxis response regulator CheB